MARRIFVLFLRVVRAGVGASGWGRSLSLSLVVGGHSAVLGLGTRSGKKASHA